MFKSSTKQIISLLLALQAIVFVAAQSTAVGTVDNTAALNVSTKADDYILENRRRYNATLQGFSDKINEINKSLEDQLAALDKQKESLLKAIQETNERLEPLEQLDVSTKYCVQKYKSELPYAAIVKANIESCFTSTRASYASIVSQLNLHYTNLLTYYNVDFKNALAACSKSYTNPSSNYTVCVTTAVSRANVYTNNYRDIYASTLQTSNCALTGRIDATVSCSASYYNSALVSLGSAERLINDCISGVSNDRPCPTVPAGCANVKTLQLKDTDFANATIINPFLGASKAQGCVEIRFI